MIDPKTVFDSPDDHWTLITAPRDTDFEGQHFDRKAIPHGPVTASQLHRLIEHIAATVSAFANHNRQGGLLVIGVNSTGDVIGTAHLSEQQRNSITNIDTLLRNQTAQVRTHTCRTTDGQEASITLIYTPNTSGGICETPGAQPKAWVRHDAQNIQVDQQRREQLLREKHFTDWERASCCPYDEAEVDRATLEAFRCQNFRKSSPVS